MKKTKNPFFYSIILLQNSISASAWVGWGLASAGSELSNLTPEEKQKNIKKRNKLLRQIDDLAARHAKGESLDEDQTKKLARKQTIIDELAFLNQS